MAKKRTRAQRERSAKPFTASEAKALADEASKAYAKVVDKGLRDAGIPGFTRFEVNADVSDALFDAGDEVKASVGSIRRKFN